MKNKVYISHHLINNRWFRLGSALVLAFILLLIPVTLGTLIRIPIPQLSGPASIAEITGQSSDRAIEVAFPFGPALVRAAGGLTVTKVAASSVDLGGILTYTLTVTNGTGGPVAPGDIVVFDYLPSGAVDCVETDPSSSSSDWSGGCTPGFDPTIWTLDSGLLANGAAAIFTYTVRISSALSNEAEIVNDNYGASLGGPPTQGPPVTTTVDAPVWAITKTVSSDTIQPGQNLVYTIIATNIGAFDTSGTYTITDMVPDNTTLISAPGASSTSPPTWEFTDPLPSSGSQIVNFTVQATSPLTNGVKIVNDGYTVFGGSVAGAATNDPITVTVDSSVTLSIVKTASADPVQVGELLTYTLTVTNNAATGPAEDVVITDTLSSFVSYLTAGFVGGSSGTITDAGDNPIIWALADPIPVGGSAQVTVTVQVSNTLPDPLEITNEFQASASNAPQVSDSMDVGVEGGDPSSGTITVTVGSSSIPICGTTVVTATFGDEFGNPISGETINLQQLPVNNATLSPSSGSTNSDGLITSTLQAITGTSVNVLANWNSFTVQDLSDPISFTGPPIPTDLSLSVSSAQLLAGGATGVVTATLTDCHTPPQPVSGKTINLTLSNVGLATFPGSSDTANGITNGSGVLTATLTSTATTPANGTVTITGTSTGPDWNLQDVTTVDIVSPVLTITKTANPNDGNTVHPDDTLIYDLTLSNMGTAAASGIVITDQLDSGVEFDTASITPSGSWSLDGGSQRITFTVSSLGMGASVIATVQVTVTAPTSGTIITNEAMVESNETVPITSNMVSHQVITTTSTNNDVFLPIVIKE